MIIGKKILVTPAVIENMENESIQAVFRDRSVLHGSKVPAFSVYIYEQIWNKFLQKASDEYSLHNNEASGIILGQYFIDKFGEYVVGTHFEAGNGSGTSSVFCEISVMDQLRILQTAKDHNLLQIIWIHSHPAFGAFYSIVDYRTLKSMYYAPHQAGIVVDNIKGEYLGFKVRSGNANEFKEIFLVNLEGEATRISRPFGKDPAKVFYARHNTTNAYETRKNYSGGLRPKGRLINQGIDTGMIIRIEKLVDDLKLLISSHHDKNDKLEQYHQNWEIKIKEFEELLNDHFGEMPYKDVVPYFNKLNEMRLLLNQGFSPTGQASLNAKLNELLNNLPKV